MINNWSFLTNYDKYKRKFAQKSESSLYALKKQRQRQNSITYFYYLSLVQKKRYSWTLITGHSGEMEKILVIEYWVQDIEVQVVKRITKILVIKVGI